MSVMLLMQNLLAETSTPAGSGGPPPSNLPPEVTLARVDTLGASPVVPATFKVQATVRDPDGIPASVVFRVGGTPFSTQAGVATKNVALDANGGTAQASASDAGQPPSLANNGDRLGNTGGQYPWWQLQGGPATLDVWFNTTYQISAINVFMVQDNYRNPSTPTLEMIGTNYVLRDFSVQYHDPLTNNWITVANYTNNDRVWVRVALTQPVFANAVRVTAVSSWDQWLRGVELEAESAIAAQVGQTIVFEASRLIDTAGTYSIDCVVTDDGGAVTTSNAVSVTAVDPTLPASNDLRSQYTEAQLQALETTTSGVVYFPMTAAGIMKLNSGQSNIDINNGEVGHAIESRFTLPEYGPDITFIKLVSLTWTELDAQGNPTPNIYAQHFVYRLPVFQQEAWINYSIILHHDCATNTGDFGWKLPGLGSFQDYVSDPNYKWGGFSCLTHNTGPLAGTNPILWDGDNYDYFDIAGQLGVSQSTPWPGFRFQEETMHSVDLRVKLNTPFNPETIWEDTNALSGTPNAVADTAALWQANGEREVWMDNQFVRLDTNVKWILHPIQQIYAFNFILMNGGVNRPRLPGMHVTVGPAVMTFGPGLRRVGKLRKLSQPPVKPTTSPSPTHGSTIVDGQGQTWQVSATAGTGGFKITRDGVWMGSFYGDELLWFNGNVYAHNSSTNHWYLWGGNIFTDVGAADPSVFTPPTGTPFANWDGVSKSPTPNSYPTWRKDMVLGVPTPIPGTEFTNALSLVALSYSGLAADDGPTTARWFALAPGGHAINIFTNGVYGIDYMQNAPQWRVLLAESPASVRDQYIADWQAGHPTGHFPPDANGIRYPVMAHCYSYPLFIRHIGCAVRLLATADIATSSWDEHDVWDEAPNKWLNGVYGTDGFAPLPQPIGVGQNNSVQSGCVTQHRITGEVFYVRGGNHQRGTFTRAPGQPPVVTWRLISPRPSLDWSFNPSILDHNRNRWVFFTTQFQTEDINRRVHFAVRAIDINTEVESGIGGITGDFYEDHLVQESVGFDWTRGQVSQESAAWYDHVRDLYWYACPSNDLKTVNCYSIHPTTFVSTLRIVFPQPAGEVLHSRVNWFPAIDAILYQPQGNFEQGREIRTYCVAMS